MRMERESLEVLGPALERLEEGFYDLPDVAGERVGKDMQKVLQEVAERMQENYPYQHPLYAGQMMKPPHPVARAAYMLALWINPNNHALDGGKASSQMEKEAVAALAWMIGWKEHLGHLTSGGTMANLEALWVGGKLRPGKRVLASEQAHYTHSRISEVLGLDIGKVASDRKGSMDLKDLRRQLRREDVGLVVATIGTTGTGSLDPLPEILELRKEYEFRVHADAAYGGYFKLAGNLSSRARKAFDRLNEVDSLVIDPHKHGLQPYGCGCILFKDPSIGRFYRHESPYTYFTSSQLHLGEISLECSRPGASAVALWATQRALPMVPGEEFAQGLERCHEAARKLYDRLRRDERFLTLFPPELDIVVWAPRADKASEISNKSERLFLKAEKNRLHLAKMRLPATQLEKLWKDVEFDQEQVTLLRSCLMKSEHLDWIDRIWEILDRSMQQLDLDRRRRSKKRS